MKTGLLKRLGVSLKEKGPLGVGETAIAATAAGASFWTKKKREILLYRKSRWPFCWLCVGTS